ncbi:hypothetical protein BG005_011533 [Podila minutissima]|nr:hypothetical protein BG005_011533 [Podila minutissima]
MPSLITIFDITLIVDYICLSLSLHDIQTCRRVCRQWASIFKPNLHIKLLSATALSKDRLATLSEHKPWIRSLTIVAQHVYALRLLDLTTLQELILYDENFGKSYRGDNPVCDHVVTTLIDNNPSLGRLEIDLNHYNYNSKRLTPALMLAIGRHPSLTKLTWRIPDDLDTRGFTQCLLRVCHSTSIQELHLDTKRRVGFRTRFRPCPYFTHQDFYNQGYGRSAEDKALLQKLEGPLEQLEGRRPFKFTTLSLAVTKAGADILLLLRNCPRLQNIRIDLADTAISAQIPGVVAEHCPRVRGLDLRIAWEAMDCGSEMRRFWQLRRVYIPFLLHEQVEQVVGVLAQSKTFKNLKEIDFGMVKIYVHESLKGHIQSEEDLESEDAIVQEWDPLQTYRPIQTMDYWWYHWKLAKKFMKEVLRAYEGVDRGAPVYMHDPHHNHALHLSALVSIFDITLIVDSICQSLSAHDIQACPRVNRQWASIFKPYAWHTVNVSSIAVLTEDNIGTLLENKRWIRSLAVAAQHIEKISSLGLTSIQELTLYDENFGHTYKGDPVNVDAIICLIDNNKGIKSLEIELNWYNYVSKKLSPALLLAIGRLPSLIKLTWRVPKGIESSEFSQCLLHVCHDSILELDVVTTRLYAQFDSLVAQDHAIGTRDFRFSLEDFGDHESDPEYIALRKRLEVPLGQWSPFSLRKLYVPTLFDTLPLLCNSPGLQHTTTSFALGKIGEITDVLAGLSHLRRLDFVSDYSDKDIFAMFEQLCPLERVYVLDLEIPDYFTPIMSALATTSQDSLTLLGSDKESVLATDVVSALTMFPKLKELDLGSIKIYAGGRGGGMEESEGDLDFNEKIIVEDWDPLQIYRPVGTVQDWWRRWTEAKVFMEDVWSVYKQEGKIRPMYMRFMYPIRAFMSREDVVAYTNHSGPWEGGRCTLTIEDAKRMLESSR